MFENGFLAGAIAGPISLLCLGYVIARRDEVVRLFAEGDGSDSLSTGPRRHWRSSPRRASGPALGSWPPLSCRLSRVEAPARRSCSSRAEIRPGRGVEC